MKTDARKCDNPNCNTIAYPESTKPYVPPYGWLWVRSGWFVGTGPDIKGLEVCSVNCIAPAVQARIEKERDR